ncbi:MAG: hypothetical protein BWX50_00965 [Euryarchaeota archaeon ADurb.Bin009]|nr:MAG: hypothetical protein BWX50_00965 [Euryarchaeota archaeon ADurb.Bin009]
MDVGGVDALRGDDQTEAVRAHDPRAVTLRDRKDPVLKRLAAFARLFEPGRDDDRHGYALLPALLDNGGHVLCRDGDDRHVDRVWYVEDGGIRLEPLHLRPLVVHGVELAREVQEVVHHGVPHLLGLGRRPDDCDGAGREVLDRHERPLFCHLLDDFVVDEYAGVDDAGPRLVQPDRVDVELHDVGVLGKEAVDRPHDLDKRLLVPGFRPAIALDHRVAVDLLDHLPDRLFRYGEDPQGDVPHQLDERAAHAEGEHLPERRIGLSAYDQFKPWCRLLLDDDALDLGFGVVGFCTLDDLLKCLFGGRF